MAIKTKDITAVGAKYVARAGVAQNDYTVGINAAVDQNAAAIAAKDAWAAGLQTAITKGTFVSGLTKAGNAKWKANSLGKGASRYPAGVAAAQPAYQAGFGPYLSTIQGLNLPVRYPRGDPRNNDRALMVQQALHKARVGS